MFVRAWSLNANEISQYCQMNIAERLCNSAPYLHLLQKNVFCLGTDNYELLRA